MSANRRPDVVICDRAICDGIRSLSAHMDDEICDGEHRPARMSDLDSLYPNGDHVGDNMRRCLRLRVFDDVVYGTVRDWRGTHPSNCAIRKIEELQR